MGSSLYAGVSGLNASSQQMDIIGNNLANVNSIGYKADKIYFGDILSKSIGGAGGAIQVGRGVSVNGISTQFNTGSLETTTNVTDLAIGGNGFFKVLDSDDAAYYTRAGAFHVNKDGLLVDSNGYTLQGASGPNMGVLGDLNVNSAMSAAEATTTISFGMNLDAEAIAGETFNASQIIYDSLGISHTIDIALENTGSNTWDYTATLNGDAATAGGTGTLTFDAGDGRLLTPAADLSITFDPPSGAGGADVGVAGVVTWDFESAAAATVTGYASPSAVNELNQDGHSSGELSGLSITTDGVITGAFTNGEVEPIGKVLLSSFKYPGGLQKAGANLFVKTIESGEPIGGNPGEQGLGEIISNALELSNTDTATEFINMIIAQRAYQANAKVITTTDAMMSELMNIKR